MLIGISLELDYWGLGLGTAEYNIRLSSRDAFSINHKVIELKHLAIIGGACICLLTLVSAQENSETPPYISLSGEFRVETSGMEVWVISTKDPSQKVKLPMPIESEDSPIDDEFHFSPDDKWIFATRHVGSCLQAGDFYHRTSETKIDSLKSLDSLAWKTAAQLRAIKEDYSAAGLCAMTFFAGWSNDSSRLLLGLLGGEDRRDNQHGYLYFNTRSKEFEMTDYLRKLNATKSPIVACAEPIDPLPSGGELKTRSETLDKRLNEAYSTKLKKLGGDRASNVRDSQRGWIKARDAGLQLYLGFVPAAERERRKFQFLADVTAARIESLTGAPADEEPFDFWERISTKP